MSVVHLIDTFTEWARTNICDHVKLKQPPADLNAPTAAGYDYKLVNPAAFPWYIPTPERQPPGSPPAFPALCVSIAGGEDSMADSERTAEVVFSLATWDTGIHGAGTFERNADGWRDAWNFLDVALRAIESNANIGGYSIDLKTPIKFGPLPEQESIPTLYPTWFAWISFRVTCPLVRNNESYQNIL